MPPLVIAHGGGRCYGPPNSLVAIEKSIELNVDMIEIDVQLSKDEVPMVIHEHNLAEFTDVKEKFSTAESYLLSDFTLNELKRLNTGTWFVNELKKGKASIKDYLQTLTTEERKKYIEPNIDSFKNVQLATLDEVLNKIKKYSLLLNIELKQLPMHYEKLTEKVLELINKHNMSFQVVISCFDHEELVVSKKINPKIATAVLVREKLYNPHLYCQNLGATGYSVSCLDVLDAIGIQSQYYQKYKQLEKKSYIEDLQKSNIDLNVWTVNEIDHMKALVEINVTGIFTDYPHRLQSVISKYC